MNNQLVNDMVNGVSGWDALLAGDEQKERQRNEMLAIAELYRLTFRTEAGKRVLAILLSQTILRPIVTPTSTEFEAGIREGRADLVRAIFKQIELAETGGQETLQPWQTLTPPTTEPAQKPKQQQTSQSQRRRPQKT